MPTTGFSYLSWKNVLGLAPLLVDSGKKLWERASSRRAPKTTPRPGSKAAPAPTADSVSAAEVRLHILEQRVAELEEEAVSSFDVVAKWAASNPPIFALLGNGAGTKVELPPNTPPFCMMSGKLTPEMKAQWRQQRQQQQQ